MKIRVKRELVRGLGYEYEYLRSGDCVYKSQGKPNEICVTVKVTEYQTQYVRLSDIISVSDMTLDEFIKMVRFHQR